MISLLFKMIGMKGDDRYGEGWGSREKLISLLMLVPKILRGLWIRLFMKSTRGLVMIGKGTKLFNLHHVSTGRNFLVDDYAEVNGLSSGGLEFGNNVTIGKYALVRPTNQYGGQIGEGLTVGNDSNIGPYCYIGCSGRITIGNNVMMSPRVSLFAENHNFNEVDRPMKEQGVNRDKIIIEDDCWIASQSIILAGTTIGKGSIVAAGSVVTKDVPPFSVVAGNPAQIIKSRKASH